MIIFAVDTLEHVRIRLSYLGFQLRQVDLVIHLITPSKLLIVFQLVRSIVFDALGALDPVEFYYVTPLLAVFTLRNA